MAIVVDAARIQRFPVQLEPAEFVRVALSQETLSLLTIEEIHKIYDVYALRLQQEELRK